VVKVSGTAALTAGDGAAITLDTVGNDLGTMSITSLNNAVTLNDVNEVDLGAMDVASLDVTSGGNITNSGAVVVAGLTALNAQNNASITLNNAGNDFSTVSVTSSGNAVNLSDSNDIELAAMMAASLTVTTGAGNITQSGGLTVSGNATFDAGTFDVTLQESNNHFNSLSITANNASINEADDTNLNTVTVANNLTLTSAGNITDTGVVTVGGVASFNATGSITLNSGNNFNTVSASSGGDVLLTDSNGIDLGVINATNLTVSAGDSITNSGAIDVGGLTILSAANNASITLNDTGNNFGTVSVTSEGNAVSLVDINEIDLATMNSASLSVTTNGNISQSGSLNITGAADFNAGTADVILTNAGNTFGTLSITANNANVSEEDDTDLESVNVTSELVLTSGGSISDGSNDATAVVVAGNATFSAGDNRAITLDGAANNFGVVTIASSSNNVTLNDIDSIELGSISAQSLTVTAQNNITQTGDVNTSGSIDYTTGTGDIAIAGAVTAGGSLIATSGNSISQTGVVSVSGDVTYQANAGDVVIGNAQDDEVSLTAQNVNITAENKITQNGGVNASGDISYTTTSSEAGDIAIVGVIDAGGSLTVTAANSIAQTGSVTATGDVAYQALGGNVTIGNVLNTAGSLTVNAFDSIAQTASVSAQGSVSYQTGETGGDIVIEGLLNSGGSMTLDAQIDVTASNALTSGGDMIIKAFTGSIDITTATAQTIDFEAAKGSIFADTISSTATTSVEGTSNLRLTATQVGTEGRLITLEVATGTATLVLDGINNTNLFDNAVSRSALLEQYVSNNVTVRGDDIVSTPAFSSAEAQSAANAGRSTTNVDNQEEGLASDESLYTTPEPSIKLPADQDEPDEFAKVEKHSDNKATDKVSGSGGFSGFVSTLIKTLNFNK
ncbi:MAG: S-layer family protein, partial [Algicola sp.]|nr:S-layer family protein [Algicola sp.]